MTDGGYGMLFEDDCPSLMTRRSIAAAFPGSNEQRGTEAEVLVRLNIHCAKRLTACAEQLGSGSRTRLVFSPILEESAVQ